jgi:hypothetical protein
MRTKRTANALAVFCGLMLLAACGDKAAVETIAQAPAAAGGEEAKGPPDKVVVYYFHGARRCPTCLGIQKIIQETVAQRFAIETDAGELVFRELDYDLDENKHYAEKFQLSFSTMIVGTMSGETVLEWENCDKVWEHAHDHPALRAYVEARISAYLEKLKKS